jgi:hypothetical protein
MSDAVSKAIEEAKATLERCHAAFNSRDSVAQTAEMQFPHMWLTSDNRFIEWATAKELLSTQNELTARLKAEGWDHTETTSLGMAQAGEDKVHLALRESLVKADGTEYNGFDTLWVFTKIDRRWRLQFRSSFLAGTAQGVGGNS